MYVFFVIHLLAIIKKMNKTDYYRKKLYEIGTTTCVDETSNWLSDIEPANDFSEIEPLFYEYKDIYKNEPNEYFQIGNVKSLLQYKFNYPMNAKSYSGIKNVPEKIDTSNKVWFGMTDYPNQALNFYPTDILKSLRIAISPTKCIDLRGLPNLQSLSVINVKTVQSFKTENLESLKYLKVSRCPKLEDLSCFKSAKNVLWVDFSVNKRVTDISVLKNYQKAMIVFINRLDVLNDSNTIDTLQQMSSLRFLYTIGGATKKQKALLKEALPNCIF